MEMRFSASIIRAIDAVMRLKEGKLGGVRPCWTNFRFPTSLRAGPIEGELWSKVRPISSRELRRTVEFFHLGKRIATVFLRGFELDDGHGRSADDFFWCVERIKYLLCTGKDEEAEIYVGENLSYA